MSRRQLLLEERVATGEEARVLVQRLDRRRVLAIFRVLALARFAGDVLHEVEAGLGLLGALRDDHRPPAGPRRRLVALVWYGDVGDPVLQVRRVCRDVAEHPVTADHERNLAEQEGVLLRRQVGWSVGAEEGLDLAHAESLGPVGEHVREGLHDLRVSRCDLAGALVEEAASIVEADHAGILAHGVIGNKRDLVSGGVERLLASWIRVHQRLEDRRLGGHFRAKGGVRHKADLGVLSRRVLLVHLVGHRPDRVDRRRTFGRVECADINAGGLQQVLAVVKGARVGVERKRVGLAFEVCLGPGEVEVVAAQAGSAELAQVLEHAGGSSLGNREPVEHVHVGTGPAADRRGELGDVRFRAGDLHHLHAADAALRVVCVDDALQAVGVGRRMRGPERDQAGTRLTARKGRSGLVAGACTASCDHKDPEHQGFDARSWK